ncbi:MAG: hypothetical protein Q8934_18950 [Bacillota bacterium]|nr:hypothetical protein [Bacillota bacterium]
MKQMMNTTRKKAWDKEKAAVLRLEMDYELATLFDALMENDKEKIMDCKGKLEGIRQELMKLKAL